jgi:glycosyltransferase involved in cell wall biosynthesis
VRVLHVITGLSAGGAEQQLRMLLPHLPAESVVAVLTTSGAVGSAIMEQGTPVLELGMRHNRDVAVLPRLVRLILSGGFDVVHTHLYRACVYGRIAARLAGVPNIVATEHSLGESVIEGRMTSAPVRSLYLSTERLGDATIAVSATVARRLANWGVRLDRIAVIPNGVDAGAFRYDPSLRQATRASLDLAADDFVVGGVGRLELTKRFDVLIDAVSEIQDAKLLLVGDGPQRGQLVERARTRGISARVCFTGEVPNVSGLLCAMDILAAPSEQETFGLAVVEALACGLPVLYVNCPALDELPAGSAPGAERIPLDVSWFQDRLAGARGLPRTRMPPPVAVDHYDIRQLAGRVAQLYVDLQAGRPITTPFQLHTANPIDERSHDVVPPHSDPALRAPASPHPVLRGAARRRRRIAL